MPERSSSPSISSSITENEPYGDEKNGTKTSSDGSYVNLKAPEEMDIGDIGDDVERMELLPPTEQEKTQPAPDNSMKSAVIWMVVNTLATIGIVRCANFTWQWLETNMRCAIGLHQQSYLLGSFVETRTAYVRGLSLFYNMAYAFYPLAASICYVCPKKSGYQGDYPSRRGYVTKCYSTQSLTRIFNSYILPSCSDSPDTYGCTYEFCSIQIYTT